MDHHAENEANEINATGSVVLDYVGGSTSVRVIERSWFLYHPSRVLGTSDRQPLRLRGFRLECHTTADAEGSVRPAVWPVMAFAISVRVVPARTWPVLSDVRVRSHMGLLRFYYIYLCRSFL